MVFAALRRSLRCGRVAWLLALALWLPAAQWAAAAHALQHLHSAASEERDPAAPLPAFCGTCVVAGAIGGAAPPSVPALDIVPRPPEPKAAAVSSPAPALRALPAYRSRAPPLLTA